MANYTILVHNNSGTVREYVLFKSEPKANSTPGNRVFQNAYINAKSVFDSTGTANFQIQTLLSAVTGIAPEHSDANVKTATNEANKKLSMDVQTSTTLTDGDEMASKNAKVKDAITDHVVVQICQSTNGDIVPGSVVYLKVVEGKPKFQSREPQETCHVDGSFSISIDGSLDSQHFGKLCVITLYSSELVTTPLNPWLILWRIFTNFSMSPDKIFVGFSAGDPYNNGDITSVSTIPAQPNTTNLITPVSKFYVSWGTQSFSDTLQASTIGSPALVDFTGKKSEKADVIHNKNGTWTVTYD